MQKTCTRCSVPKPLSAFTRRAASKDGYTAACTACIAQNNRMDYWTNDAVRERTIQRTAENKRLRFERDPAYKRAFNLWCTTRRRTRIPPWVRITDFMPICKTAVRKGPDYVLDHIVPLKHPLVCGLHVPWNMRVVLYGTNARKHNSFAA